MVIEFSNNNIGEMCKHTSESACPFSSLDQNVMPNLVFVPKEIKLATIWPPVFRSSMWNGLKHLTVKCFTLYEIVEKLGTLLKK